MIIDSTTPWKEMMRRRIWEKVAKTSRRSTKFFEKRNMTNPMTTVVIRNFCPCHRKTASKKKAWHIG